MLHHPVAPTLCRVRVDVSVVVEAGILEHAVAALPRLHPTSQLGEEAVTLRVFDGQGSQANIVCVHIQPRVLLQHTKSHSHPAMGPSTTHKVTFTSSHVSIYNIQSYIYIQPCVHLQHTKLHLHLAMCPSTTHKVTFTSSHVSIYNIQSYIYI